MAASLETGGQNMRVLLFHWIASIVLLFLTSVGIYTWPLWQVTKDNGMEEAVLDEMFILGDDSPSRANNDVMGLSPVWELWRNDYWGKPLTAPDSHRSWRPLSVLSLRWCYQSFQKFPYPIFLHRMVNVVFHAIVAQLVGAVAMRLHRPPLKEDDRKKNARQLWVFWIATLLFAVHPVHVEAVANTANRPHVLALFFSLLSSLLSLRTTDTDDGRRRSWVGSVATLLTVGLCWTAGLLCAETMVFQLPAIIVTTAMMEWQQRDDENAASWKKLLPILVPRYIVWIVLTGLYLGYRFLLQGSLDIPTGLLGRAEIPFGQLQGLTRIRSYAYVVAIHIGKAFGIDLVGFAHEYAYNCIRPLDQPADPRVLVPILLLVGIAWTTKRILKRDEEERGMIKDGAIITNMGLWIVALMWTATLFPTSGLIKVGFFVADRMVLPSTVVLAVFGSHLWVRQWHNNNCSGTTTILPPRRVGLLAFLCFLLLGFWGPRVVQRTRDWMFHSWLFERTHETCPKSAKNLLQLSKLYSGKNRLMVQRDLPKAMDLVEQSQQADPEFCRVHYQFAYIYLQQNEPTKMEPALAEGLWCPITAGQAGQLWQQYWQIILSEAQASSNGDPERLRSVMQRRDALLEKSRRKHIRQQQRGNAGERHGSQRAEL